MSASVALSSNMAGAVSIYETFRHVLDLNVGRYRFTNGTRESMG